MDKWKKRVNTYGTKETFSENKFNLNFYQKMVQFSIAHVLKQTEQIR